MFEFSLLLLLAWGALAFGAEYAWAYAPLLVFSLVPAILGFRRSRGALPARPLLVALAAIALAVIIQIFVPAAAIAGWQRGAPGVDYDALYARTMLMPAPAWQAHAISIAPARTALGLAFIVAFTLLFAGVTRGISALGPRKLVRGLIVIGVVVAFVGLIQRAVQAEEIYGFFRRSKPGIPFAPFMNENHFAGWMAMILSLAVGSFAGGVARAFQRIGPAWRDRVLWFSSPQASEMLLTGFAAAVMALSMVLTFSRGGLVGLVTVAAVGAAWMLRRQPGPRRFIGGAALVLVVAFAAVWGGAEKTIDQFSGASEDMGGRQSVWADTIRIARDYPLTGTGFNTFGIAMLHYQTSSSNGPRREIFIEAHNDYLQLAAEGGLLMGVPLLMALGLFVWQIRRRFEEAADDEETYWLRAGAVTGLCAIAVMEIFDFTLQMPGAAAAFVVLAAIAVHRPHHLLRRSSRHGESRSA